MKFAKLFTNIFSNSLPDGNNFVEISGAVKGEIYSDGTVYINHSGHLEGKIEAKCIEIAGIVQGDVKTKSLVILSSGKLFYNELDYQYISKNKGSMLININKLENINEKSTTNNAISVNEVSKINVINDVSNINAENEVSKINDEYIKSDSNKIINFENSRQMKQSSTINTHNIQEAKPYSLSENEIKVDRQPQFYSSY